MILTAIITGFCFFFQSIFSIFTVPAMPTVITNALGWITEQLNSVIQLFHYIYTPLFFNALLFIGIGVLTFDYAYGFVMWVIRKIPILGVK